MFVLGAKIEYLYVDQKSRHRTHRYDVEITMGVQWRYRMVYFNPQNEITFDCENRVKILKKILHSKLWVHIVTIGTVHSDK